MLEKSVGLLPQTVFEINNHGKITYVNQAGCDILGYSREELKQMRVFDLIVPEEENAGDDRFRKKVMKQLAHASTYTVRRKDGTVFPAIVYSAPTTLANGAKGVIGILADATTQKMTEKRLLESEDRFHALFEIVPDAMFIKDRDLRYTDVNPAMAKLTGLPREKVIGATDRELFEEVADWIQENDRSVLNGATTGAENTIRINQRTMVLDVIKTPMRDQDGNIIGICGIARDVTERRKTEAVLLETEERYRTVIEKMNDAVAIIKGNRHIFVNQRFIEMFGFKDLNEVINGRPYSYIHPDDRATVMVRHRERQYDSGGSEQYEFRGLTCDGRTIDMEAAETEMTLQGQDVTLIFLRDITQRKLAAQQIEAERRRLLDIIEFLPDATFAINNDKRVIAWNRAMEMVTGVPKAEILGKTTYSEAFYGHKRTMLVDVILDESPAVGDEYDSLNWVGSDVYAENSIQKSADQNPKHLWGAASPLLDSDGKRVGVIETVRDISERKRLESQFIHSQKMEAVGNLASGIAHDFNNLLSVIMGYSALLKMKVYSAPTQLESYADEVINAAERASRLTASLLAFSRKQTLRMKPVDLTTLIREAEKLLSRLLTEDVEFTVRLPGNDVVVMADQLQIEQVLMNLVANARDALLSKGKVTIGLNTLTMDETFIRNNAFGKAGRYAVITCSDTGCGMDRAVLDHIYEPFYTTKEVGKGTGLGLPTVLGIIEQHGGYISIDSEPGKGTTFFVYIPIIEHSAPLHNKDQGQPEAAQGTETILLAEDDAALRALMEDVLRSHGYRVLAAGDGDAALGLFMENSEKIDLLFLDVVMPGKNGKEVYYGARDIKPDIRVLFYSGYNDEVITDKGFSPAPVLCLKKPVELDEVLNSIRAVLDNKLQRGHE